MSFVLQGFYTKTHAACPLLPSRAPGRRPPPGSRRLATAPNQMIGLCCAALAFGSPSFTGRTSSPARTLTSPARQQLFSAGHQRSPAPLLLSTPLHRLELDEQLLDIDGLIKESAAGGKEARDAYLVRRKARIDKELHSKDRGGEIRFGQ